MGIVGLWNNEEGISESDKCNFARSDYLIENVRFVVHSNILRRNYQGFLFWFLSFVIMLLSSLC